MFNDTYNKVELLLSLFQFSTKHYKFKAQFLISRRFFSVYSNQSEIVLCQFKLKNSIKIFYRNLVYENALLDIN